MGSVASTPETSSFENVESEGRNRRSEQQIRQKKQEDRTWRETLGETTGDSSLPGDSMHSQPSPSFIRGLQSTMPSNQIFNSNMVPGVWVTAKAPSSQAFISASIPVQPFGGDANGNDGGLHASKSFHSGQIDIRANTSGSINASASLQPSPRWKLGGVVDTAGTVSLSCDKETFLGSQKEKAGMIQLGSWAQFQSPSKFAAPSDVAPSRVGGHAALYLPSCVMAVEATSSVERMSPELSYHLTADMSDPNAHPLLLSLQKSPHRSSASVTYLHKDQKLAWTMEMEKQANQNQADLRVGMFHAMNENIGAKIVADSSKLSGSVVLRRLEEPRAKCSLLFGVDAHNRKAAFTGIALEIDS